MIGVCREGDAYGQTSRPNPVIRQRSHANLQACNLNPSQFIFRRRFIGPQERCCCMLRSCHYKSGSGPEICQGNEETTAEITLISFMQGIPILFHSQLFKVESHTFVSHSSVGTVSERLCWPKHDALCLVQSQPNKSCRASRFISLFGLKLESMWHFKSESKHLNQR